MLTAQREARARVVERHRRDDPAAETQGKKGTNGGAIRGEAEGGAARGVKKRNSGGAGDGRENSARPVRVEGRSVRTDGRRAADDMARVTDVGPGTVRGRTKRETRHTNRSATVNTKPSSTRGCQHRPHSSPPAAGHTHPPHAHTAALAGAAVARGHITQPGPRVSQRASAWRRSTRRSRAAAPTRATGGGPRLAGQHLHPQSLAVKNKQREDDVRLSA